MIKNIKKLIFMSILLILFLQNFIYATKLIDTVEHSGKYDDCVFIGDSYTEMLKVYYGSSLDCEGHEGYKVEKLKPYMDNLIKKNKPNIIFMIGPNDYLAQTPVDDFYNILVSYMRLLQQKTNSRIFFCSYLDFMYNVKNEDFRGFKYKIKDYDEKVRQLCEAENIVYIDLWDIGDVNKIRGLSDADGDNDMFHYGNSFYEEFMQRVREKITEQEEVENQILFGRKENIENNVENKIEDKKEDNNENGIEDMNRIEIKNGPGINIKKEVENEDGTKKSICTVTMMPET